MVWGKTAGTAIHGHAGFEGTVKVIQGAIREEKYEFSDSKIRQISSGIFFPGEILPEDIDTIHSIINQNYAYSVTLHIYNTGRNTLAGTVLYDPDTKKIGILNDLAKTTSWNEDPTAFKCIIPFEQYTGEERIFPAAL
jgi:hypothetical protein